MPEKTDEGIKSVSADKINEFFESGGKKLKVKSDNEKLKEITDLKPKAGFMTILYRQMRLNMDLVLLFTIILCFTCFGYCLAFVTLAFSTGLLFLSYTLRNTLTGYSPAPPTVATLPVCTVPLSILI